MRLNVKYYLVKLKQANTWNKVTEWLIGICSSSAIIAWVSTPWGLTIWKVLGSLAVLLVVYRNFVLKPYDNIMMFERRVTFYRGVEFQLETVCRKIRELRVYNDSLRKDFEEIIVRRQTFAQTDGDSVGNKKLLQRIQEEVNRELPLEYFYEPEGDRK